MHTYLEEIKKAMDLLDKEGYFFIGQNMRFSGTSMYHTYKHIPENRRIELPVLEDVQAGLGTGLSLEGFKILSIVDVTRIPRGGPKKKGGRRGRRV